jgi:hypothetical protein
MKGEKMNLNCVSCGKKLFFTNEVEYCNNCQQGMRYSQLVLNQVEHDIYIAATNEVASAIFNNKNNFIKKQNKKQNKKRLHKKRTIIYH